MHHTQKAKIINYNPSDIRFVYNKEEQVILSQGYDAENGKVLYALGEEGVEPDNAVFTEEIPTVKNADEKVKLGRYFMDKYEDPEIHNQNEKI